ncbi:MAG: permease [Muribaculaceae bacterium]|nr:permease [Muribaculaceae bacterium]
MELIDSLLMMLCEMSPYILLGFLIAGLMHAFIPQKSMARHLSGTGWKPVVKSALIGIPLPLCSCGVLPAAIAMRRNGASRAASTSFLVATPQTGVDSIAATWSLLGPAFALNRPIAALVTAVFGGVAVGKAETEASVCCESPVADAPVSRRSTLQKIGDALRYGYVDLVSSIGGWLVTGLVIAALITVYVPADFFAILGRTPILSMIAVLLIAIPMYVCATGSIPIAMSLMLKGLSPGTALVLLMAGPAANFASFTLISREMGRKSAIIYLVSIIAGAIAFGLIIDYLLPASWFAPGLAHGGCTHGHVPGLFPLICSGVLVVLLAYALIRPHRHNHHKIIDSDSMTKEYQIKGMNCPHCQASVAKAIASVDGVTNVDVNLGSGKATVEGEHDPARVIAAVHAAGFEAAASDK